MLQVPVDIYGVGSFFFEGENNDFTADIVRVKIDGSWHDMAKTGRGARQSGQTHPVVY
jgi:nicotinate phosphoribosyltransferase